MAQSGDSLGELKIEVGVELDQASIRRANEAAANQATNVWADAAREIEASNERAAEESSDRWESALGGIATAAAAGLAAAGAAFSALSANVYESALAIDRQARSMGMSTDEVQRWRYVAEQAGLEGNDLGEAMGGLAQRASDAAANGGDAARRFRDLGIELTDANGAVRPAGELMADAAEALHRMGPGTEQTATAMALFGEKGRLLLPVLSRGREGIAELGAEFDELGGGIDAETIETMRELDRTIMRLRLSFMREVMPIVRAAGQRFQELADRARPWVQRMSAMVRDSHNVRTALAMLSTGAAVLAAAFVRLKWQAIQGWLAVTGPVVGVAALVALAVLAWEDLFTTLEGGDSVTRRLLTSMFGAGRAAEMIDGAAEAWNNIKASADSMIATIELLAVAVQSAGRDMWSALEPLHPLFGGIATVLDRVFAAIDRVMPRMEQLAGMAAQVFGGPLGGFLANAAQAPAATSQSNAAQIRGATSGALSIPQVPIFAPPSAVSAGAGQMDKNAGGGVNVAASARAQVQVSGVIDPTSPAFLQAVNRAVEDAMLSANERALDGIAKGRG